MFSQFKFEINVVHASRMIITICMVDFFLIFQITITTFQPHWNNGALLIGSIQFKTYLGNAFGPYGSEPNLMPIPEIKVLGQRLVYIAGTQGNRIDSLTFHFG